VSLPTEDKSRASLAQTSAVSCGKASRPGEEGARYRVTPYLSYAKSLWAAIRGFIIVKSIMRQQKTHGAWASLL